uniref:Flagellar hook-basal body complex protein n=1 Tax=Anaerolinea thermolimosa TaxID=229919 RepID=A0A7C4KJL7_9CHLR
MGQSLYHTLNISRQDMLTRLLDLDVVSNNLANMNTAGFKASRANFQELLTQNLNRSGIRLPSTQMLPGQGTIRQSSNPLDWAIEGEGFFSVRLPDGRTAYTRDGQFTLDASRRLVCAGGFPLVWNGQIPENYSDISIRSDGTVEVVLQDGARQVAGNVQLARFANPGGLQGIGNNLWAETAASGQARMSAPGSPNVGIVHTHAVEQANVDLAREMTQLMADQRTFQMSVQAFQQTDQMIALALNLRKG